MKILCNFYYCKKIQKQRKGEGSPSNGVPFLEKHPSPWKSHVYTKGLLRCSPLPPTLDHQHQLVTRIDTVGPYVLPILLDFQVSGSCD